MLFDYTQIIALILLTIRLLDSVIVIENALSSGVVTFYDCFSDGICVQIGRSQRRRTRQHVLSPSTIATTLHSR